MDITLNRNDAPRRSHMVVFGVEGRNGSVRFSKSLFANHTAPARLTLSNTSFSAPKVKETAAERKARLALVTPAERIAKQEARLARMKAQLTASPKAQATPKANGVVSAKPAKR